MHRPTHIYTHTCTHTHIYIHISLSLFFSLFFSLSRSRTHTQNSIWILLIRTCAFFKNNPDPPQNNGNPMGQFFFSLARTRTHIHTHTHTHTHMHTYTHIHTHQCRFYSHLLASHLKTHLSPLSKKLWPFFSKIRRFVSTALSAVFEISHSSNISKSQLWRYIIW